MYKELHRCTLGNAWWFQRRSGHIIVGCLEFFVKGLGFVLRHSGSRQGFRDSPKLFTLSRHESNENADACQGMPRARILAVQVVSEPLPESGVAQAAEDLVDRRLAIATDQQGQVVKGIVPM